MTSVDTGPDAPLPPWCGKGIREREWYPATPTSTFHLEPVAMSFLDDLCDFCGGYIDGMGCDTKTLLKIEGKDKYWDGQCIEGMDAQWSSYSVPELANAERRYQERYDEDPIDWTAERITTPSGYQLRIQQLFLLDRAEQLRRYIVHREQAS